jgi:mannose-6-phosphate isomerase
MAEFLGVTNAGGNPQAELWIGAHPLLPSGAVTDQGTIGLDVLIRRAPDEVLGIDVAGRHGGQLPFLLKVLAIAAPLSIQCHPNIERARAGFAREEAAGIPRDAPERNYRDANHKPELIMALTPLVVLKGFRPAEETIAALEIVQHPALGGPIETLRRDGEAGLGAFLAALVSLSEPERKELTTLFAAEALDRAASDPAWDWVGRLARRYPHDVGLLSPLYLNLVTLAPGQGLYLPAGELHAYLDGMGVEIMANSDNVLRGGLTPKHVDIAELLRLLTFTAGRPAALSPAMAADGALVFPTPAAEFELALVDVEPETPRAVAADHGIEILLVLDGRARVASGGVALDLARGASVLIPAAAPAYRIEGAARVARARVPRGRR